MTTNVGKLDRTLRAALGVVLLFLAFFSGLALFDAVLFKYGAALIGLIMLATATLKMCPLYSLLGLKTCKDC
ncbi:hypothetical protein AN189_08290 [Loktanella sp. 3ANDIMAR09]|uniref:YgaP family membrane protein n=1 Tax=Loktanella sp. 3ANDIMAR09 TaxID=1225657 RepID=UPI0006FDF30A|nr:DUF2892 domain-containing protein [Loktanella sp. 3ANDIMAR09]KQI68849.1 hypothetical protein AN189_08290 [Loktanella sp. 3ANDIMAR09]